MKMILSLICLSLALDTIFLHVDFFLRQSLHSWQKDTPSSSDVASYQFCCCCSVTKSCLTLFNHIDCSTPGSPVLHYFLEFAQIHVH